LGTACFLKPRNPNNRLPDKLCAKRMVASSDKKERKPKKLHHESNEIVAIACSSAQSDRKPPNDSRSYLDSEQRDPYTSLDTLSSPDVEHVRSTPHPTRGYF
jgi:hypothetical protein